MKAVISPGPSYSDPNVKLHAGWFATFGSYQEALEELGYDVHMLEVDPQVVDRTCTVSQELSYDVAAYYELLTRGWLDEVDLFLGSTGYSITQMAALRKAKKIVWTWNNADWFRDQQLIEEYKRFNFPYDTSPAWRLINRIALETCDHVIATTTHIGETLTRLIPHEKISIVPKGVDCEKFSPMWEKDTGTFKVLFSATDIIRKGFAYLIEAVRDMKGVEIWSVGPSPLYDPPDYIRQFDMVPFADVQKIYRQCDIFCMPTLEDGFSNALHEAMACGVVPITTPVISEAFQHKVSGLEVGYRDIAGIRASIRYLQESPDVMEKMGKEARLQAEKCSWDVAKERLKEVVREVTS